MKFPPDFREFIELANSANVPLLMIGGWAYNSYAEPRATGDIDFFVADTLESEKQVRALLVQFGFGFALPPNDVHLFANQVIMLGRPPNRIDILNQISGVAFDQAWANRQILQVDGLSVAVICRTDLIKNKLAAGREKDLLDARVLSLLSEE